MRRRVHWPLVALTVLIVGAVSAISLYYYADSLVERRLRPATIAFLEQRFDSKVELADLSVTLRPALQVRGEGLTLRHQGRTDIPPLISIRAFTISGGLRELWQRRIDRIHLEGLELMIPPRRGKDMPKFTEKVSDEARDAAGDGQGDDVYINELVTENSLLTIMSKRADKGPRVFQLRKLRFERFVFSDPIPFEAAITNPTPHGEIAAVGTFGPWVSATPSLTRVDGTFIFDADLGTIKGIGGALHAEGDFAGPLEYLRTSGRTTTRDFHLSSGSARFPLTLDYIAVVDGTNGDTHLEKVEGVLGTTRIAAKGDIVKVEGRHGRRITLDTRTRGGRLEDLVRLTTRVSQSPLTGLVDADARLDIPPGDAEVIERMDLDGTFSVERARFTSAAVQDRVDELARRGQGRPDDASIDNVASNLKGSFQLKNARLQLRSLTFGVEGAAVRLAGGYDIARERLDFAGELRLQAKVSQTQTGWKRLVLKLFDPMLDGPGAGTVLPISITGTREQPKFAADIKKAILR